MLSSPRRPRLQPMRRHGPTKLEWCIVSVRTIGFARLQCESRSQAELIERNHIWVSKAAPEALKVLERSQIGYALHIEPRKRPHHQ
jgi:hypothetical protein